MECLSAPFSNIQMDVIVLLKIDYSDETGRTYESCTHLELFNAFSTPDGLVVFKNNNDQCVQRSGTRLSGCQDVMLFRD